MSKHVPPPTRHAVCRARIDSGFVGHPIGCNAAERAEALQRLRGLRKEAADEIDRLLEFLDAVDDTDVDSQCDDDPIDDLETEPSLGWTASAMQSDQDYATPATTSRHIESYASIEGLQPAGSVGGFFF